jgi:hypothetical protein
MIKEILEGKDIQEVLLSERLDSKHKEKVDELLAIINKKKAGRERTEAMEELYLLVHEITGKKVSSFEGALLALDYKEPKVR